MKGGSNMRKFIKTNELYEDDRIVLVETSFETENGIRTSIEVAVKNSSDDIIRFIPVIDF